MVRAGAGVNAGTCRLVLGLAASVGAVVAIFAVAALPVFSGLVATPSCAEANCNSHGRVALGARDAGLSGVFSVCGHLGMVEFWGK